MSRSDRARNNAVFGARKAQQPAPVQCAFSDSQFTNHTADSQHPLSFVQHFLYRLMNQLPLLT